MIRNPSGAWGSVEFRTSQLVTTAPLPAFEDHLIGREVLVKHSLDGKCVNNGLFEPVVLFTGFGESQAHEVNDPDTPFTASPVLAHRSALSAAVAEPPQRLPEPASPRVTVLTPPGCTATVSIAPSLWLTAGLALREHGPDLYGKMVMLLAAAHLTGVPVPVLGIACLVLTVPLGWAAGALASPGRGLLFDLLELTVASGVLSLLTLLADLLVSWRSRGAGSRGAPATGRTAGRVAAVLCPSLGGSILAVQSSSATGLGLALLGFLPLELHTVMLLADAARLAAAGLPLQKSLLAYELAASHVGLALHLMATVAAVGQGWLGKSWAVRLPLLVGLAFAHQTIERDALWMFPIVASAALLVRNEQCPPKHQESEKKE